MQPEDEITDLCVQWLNNKVDEHTACAMVHEALGPLGPGTTIPCIRREEHVPVCCLRNFLSAVKLMLVLGSGGG